MRKKVGLSEAAYYDIESIFSYISQDNKEAADRLRLGIYEAIGGLRDFPEAGPVIPEEIAPGAVRGYRRILVQPYIVFYRVMEDRIVIAKVLHGRRNWLQSLLGESPDGKDLYAE